MVEIQYFDGDLDELDLDAWYGMEIELTEAPENWSGPLDVAELDDLGTEVTDTQPRGLGGAPGGGACSGARSGGGGRVQRGVGRGASAGGAPAGGDLKTSGAAASCLIPYWRT